MKTTSEIEQIKCEECGEFITGKPFIIEDNLFCEECYSVLYYNTIESFNEEHND